MLRCHDICFLVESRLFMGVPLEELMLKVGGKLINTCQHGLKKIIFLLDLRGGALACFEFRAEYL